MDAPHYIASGSPQKFMNRKAWLGVTELRVNGAFFTKTKTNRRKALNKRESNGIGSS